MKASQFLFTIFFLAATIAVAFAKPPISSNARIIAKSYYPKVKAKGGQLKSDLRFYIFDGLGLDKPTTLRLWKHIKHNVGAIIWKTNHAEIKALPGLINPTIKGSLKGNATALDEVLKASTPKIIKDFQSRAPALLAGLTKRIPTKVARSLNHKKPDIKVVIKVKKNIKAAVKFWKTKQLPNFAKNYTSAKFPPALFKKLN
jgi:hypothetical protein